MDIRSSLAPVPVYPSPVRKTDPVVSAYAQTEPGIASVRRPADVLTAETLLHHRQTRLGLQQDYPDQHTRRALEAYSALEQIQQRAYVSRVLGIDEYA